MRGNGVRRDPEKAARLYRVAASRRANHISVLNNAGYGVWQDHFEAAKWLLRAAEQGHPNAQNAHAYMY